MKAKHKFKYDINAILSDLVYTRILEPAGKRSSFKTTSEFLEKPFHELHDVYRALDCSNYYFEIEQEEGSKKYGKSKGKE